MAKIDTADITPRTHALIVFGLTEPQWEALDKFSQPGGHGFGEYANLPTPTAKALEARRLVTLGWRGVGRDRFKHGDLTPAGRALLDAVKRETDVECARRRAEFAAKMAEIESRMGGLR